MIHRRLLSILIDDHLLRLLVKILAHLCLLRELVWPARVRRAMTLLLWVRSVDLLLALHVLRRSLAHLRRTGGMIIATATPNQLRQPVARLPIIIEIR